MADMDPRVEAGVDSDEEEADRAQGARDYCAQAAAAAALVGAGGEQGNPGEVGEGAVRREAADEGRKNSGAGRWSTSTSAWG